MRIREAVRFWRQIENEGNAPLHIMPLCVPVPHSTHRLAHVSEHAQLDTLVQTWLDAVLDFDEQRAEALLTEAFALYPPETVVLQMLRPALFV